MRALEEVLISIRAGIEWENKRFAASGSTSSVATQRPIQTALAREWCGMGAGGRSQNGQKSNGFRRSLRHCCKFCREETVVSMEPGSMYVDTITLVIRATNDFRFPDLYIDDGEQVTITIPPGSIELSRVSIRDGIKSTIITPHLEPYQISDTYREIEAGFSGSTWEFAVEFGTDTLKDIAIPALVAWITARLSARRDEHVASAADALIIERVEEFAIQEIRRRFPAVRLEDSVVKETTIASDGSGSSTIQLPDPDGRRFKVDISFDPKSRLRVVRMTRVSS